MYCAHYYSSTIVEVHVCALCVPQPHREKERQSVWAYLWVWVCGACQNHQVHRRDIFSYLKYIVLKLQRNVCIILVNGKYFLSNFHEWKHVFSFTTIFNIIGSRNSYKLCICTLKINRCFLPFCFYFNRFSIFGILKKRETKSWKTSWVFLSRLNSHGNK